jgi:hypothetical protein
MPTQENSHWRTLAQTYFAEDIHRPEQPSAILRAVAKRRTVRARLAEWQIAAQHEDAGGTKCVRHGNRQGRVAVGTGAMREHQCLSRGRVRAVQKTAYHRLTGRLIDKSFQ